MNFGRILAKRAMITPEKVALIFENRRYTYSMLNRNANRLSNALIGLGIQQGDRVAVLLYNCPEYLEIYFALAKAGIIMVPLNFRMVSSEIQFIINDSEPKAIFFGPEFLEIIDNMIDRLPKIKIMVSNSAAHPFMGYEELQKIGTDREVDADYGMSLDQLIMYTSGTTGRPKGAVLTYGNSLWNAINTAADFGIRPDDITLTSAPLFHIGGLNVLTTPHLYLGATVVLTKQFDPELIWRLIQEEKVTNMFAVPQMYQMMMQVSARTKYKLDSLRFVESGGGPCPVSVIEQYFNELNVLFMQGYGLTEASPSVSLLRSEDSLRKAGSIGKPFLHVDVRVVDYDEKDVKQSTPGELIISGPTVMHGYWQLPEETAANVRNGWLHTGDLARYDEEGYLYIVDRKKDMIISGGENIYPAEIEQVLYSHPKILEAAVIGIGDEKWGETVKAFVVLKDGQQMIAEEVIEHCKNNLASYKKPRAVEFIQSLPRNAAGKVLKRKLRET